MGLLQKLGWQKKAPKAATKPKRRRRTKAQMQADEIRVLDQDLTYLRKKAEYDKAVKRLGLSDSDADESWADVFKKSFPKILDMGQEFASNLSKSGDPAIAAAPAQIPATATTGPQPGDDQLDTYSRAILPNVRGKSPEDAAAYLRALGRSDPVMGKAVIGRLVKTPEAQLPNLLDDYEAFAPAFIQYCRANPEWFIKVVRCLKPPTNIAPVDPVAAAL
jgi:hypothetical protein